jgi:hypothetical protein
MMTIKIPNKSICRQNRVKCLKLERTNHKNSMGNIICRRKMIKVWLTISQGKKNGDHKFRMTTLKC